MAVVRRIFSLIGSAGQSLSGTARTLEREGVPSPSGNRVWAKPTIKGIVLDDAYRTLSCEQMQDLAAEGHLTADVLSRLDREKRYGIWWFNRSHKTQKRVAVDTPNGREYKTRSKSVLRPRSEWIAVPVPDCGVPPELVDAARNAVKDNRSPSSARRRVFDLSGGVLHCATCGRRMGGSSVFDPKTGRRYFYYTCSRLRNSDSAGCETKIRSVRADVLEPRIWEFVSGLILEPGRLYKTLKVRVVIHDDGTPEVSGVFATGEHALEGADAGAESSEKRNAIAIALYEKFGFEVEGTHRRLAFRDGEYVDAYSMARLKPYTNLL
jgi:hypothetical protein